MKVKNSRRPLTIFSAAVFAFFFVLSATSAEARSLFLNGVDISSARSQELKNVTVQINENGDIFIIAPHYQVNEEDTYVPLSKYVQGINLPVHKKPVEMSQKVKKGQQYKNGHLQKAGEKKPAEGSKGQPKAGG